MKRRYLRFLPRNVQELYEPRLKRARLEKERKERIENILRREVQAVVRQFGDKEIVLTTEEKNVLYSPYAAREPLNCMVSILEKAIEANPDNHVIRTVLCRSYDILRGDEPKLARKVMEILRKNQSKSNPEG